MTAPKRAERHYVRIRYVVTCDVCGDIGEVGTIGEGSALAVEHEQGEQP